MEISWGRIPVLISEKVLAGRKIPLILITSARMLDDYDYLIWARGLCHGREHSRCECMYSCRSSRYPAPFTHFPWKYFRTTSLAVNIVQYNNHTNQTKGALLLVESGYCTRTGWLMGSKDCRYVLPRCSISIFIQLIYCASTTEVSTLSRSNIHNICSILARTKDFVRRQKSEAIVLLFNLLECQCLASNKA